MRCDTKNMIHFLKTNKMDFIKITTFCSGKGPLKRMKSQAIGGEKIFANHISDKELISSVYKELLNSTFRKQCFPRHQGNAK